jgi:hypothetical protein
MNIDYRVRNSIYCTPASRALSAAQLLNGPSHARLTFIDSRIRYKYTIKSYFTRAISYVNNNNLLDREVKYY